MTTGIYGAGYGYNDYFYNQYQNGYNYQNSGIYDSGSGLNFTGNDTLSKPPKRKVEKDDGNIGFWKATKNFGKGVVKFFTGMFTDKNGNFSLTQTLKTAAIAVGVGALCVLTAGTAVPAMLAATGIGISALGMGKAAINIATADTDAEAEAAWQSLGSNTTAAALAVTGAKAVAKANGVNTQGFKGTVDSVKYVLNESGAAIKSSATGITNAVKGASGTGLEGKWNAVKNEVSAQASDFATTVKGNYNKAVYGTKTKIDDDAAALDKKSSDLQKKIDKAKDGTPEKAKLQKEQAEINAKRDGINEINRKNNWEDANTTIDGNKAKLRSKQGELARATTDADKARIQGEIDALNTKIKVQENVLARRTGEAQHIRSQIEAKEAQIAKLDATKDAAKITKLESEITALKNKQEFTIPNKNDASAIKAEGVKNQQTVVSEQRTNVTNAQNAVAEAEQALKAVNPADKAAVAKAQQTLNIRKSELRLAKRELDAQITSYRYIQNKYNAQQGNGYSHVPNEMGRAFGKDPAAQWLTLGITGKQFGFSNPYVDFYSQLNSQEKAYFDALPDEHKAALIEQYKNAVA